MAISRYDRQQRFHPIGDAGQRCIRSAKVLVVGAGALGSVVVEILARAGVGCICLVDRDIVEITNLQRQALYTEGDANQGLAKVEAAATAVRRINSEVVVESFASDLTAANIRDIISDDVDIIVDATDNFETRFLINDYSLEYSVPWVHGGCVGANGQVFLFVPGKTICLRCLVPTLPAPGTTETCETAGVLGPATHAIASIQASEVLRYLVLKSESARSKVLAMDLWSMRWREIETAGLRQNQCPACELGRRDFLFGTEAGSITQTLCGRNSVQVSPASTGSSVDLEKMIRRWEHLGATEMSRFFVRLTVGEHTLTVFKDGRAIVLGTQDAGVARSLYAKYVGI